MNDILNKQKEFERLVGIPIDTILEKERNQMSEMFLYKAIEELIEARREFPSVLNEWSKSNKEADNVRVKEELSDAFLFLSNLLLAWHITWDQFMEQVKSTQENNFSKVKEKKMKSLNEEILNVPGYTSGIGSGNINPKYVFIGINPGKEIPHGYKFWSDPESGSSKNLLPILDGYDIRDKSYFTNLVKSTTIDNKEPSQELIDFWMPFLTKEIAILTINNPDMKVITMGKLVRENYEGSATIDHPASVSYNPQNSLKFQNQIIEACGLQSSLF